MAVTLDAIASSHGAYRGVACVEDSVTDRDLHNLSFCISMPRTY
jgi:hypothetical protein